MLETTSLRNQITIGQTANQTFGDKQKNVIFSDQKRIYTVRMSVYTICKIPINNPGKSLVDKMVMILQYYGETISFNVQTSQTIKREVIKILKTINSYITIICFLGKTLGGQGLIFQHDNASTHTFDSKPHSLMSNMVSNTQNIWRFSLTRSLPKC